MLKTGQRRTCRHCGTEFHDAPNLPRGHWSRFCTETCRDAAKIAAAIRTIRRQYQPRAHRIAA